MQKTIDEDQEEDAPLREELMKDVFTLTDDCEIDYTRATKWPQILAAMAAAFSAFVMGNTFGWSSPVQPQLQQNSTLNLITDVNSTWYIEMDDDQFSWVGSLINIGASIGALCSGFLIDRFGRSRTLMAMSVPYLIGWLLIALAVNPFMLYLGRVLGGLASGVTCGAAPCYIGEVSTPNHRGTVGFFFSANIGLGILFPSILGLGLDWRWISSVSAISPILLFMFLYFVPESPYFLVKKNDLAEATKALKWLRGSRYNVDTELAQIKARLLQDGTQKLRFTDYFSPWAYKPILIGVAMMVFQQFSGMNAAMFYAVDILRVAESDLDALVAAVIISIMPIVGTFLGVFVVARIGRRPLLMMTELTSCLSMAALGAHFYILANDPSTAKSLGWLPLASLIVFLFGLGLGLGPLAWLISSEVLPAKIRGQGSSIAALTNTGFAFIVTKTFIDIQRAVTTAGAFWFYAGVSFFGFLFAFFILPETKDKSQQEIEIIFGAPPK